MTDEEFEVLTEDHRPTPRSRYEHVLHDFLDDLFLAYPTWATQIGFHEYDHRWPDLTDSARLSRIEMLRRHRRVAEGLDEGDLGMDERVDRGLLLESIDALLFEDEVLREATWDPLSYVYLLGSGFFSLLARDYAPFAHRGSAFLVRLRRIPDVLAAARDNLQGLPGRPVSLLHTQTALEQLSGVSDLIDEAIIEAGRQGGEEADLRRALEDAAPAARAALDDFRAFLERDVRQRASGEGRLGAQLFQEKLRHTLASDLPHEDLQTAARRDWEVVRTEMVRLARELWPTWVPSEPLPAANGSRSAGEAEGEMVRRVLDAIAEEHPRPDDLLERAQAEVDLIERFCREQELIGLPDDPLRITWTPVFMRAYGGAFLDSPGPLDKGQSSYFWITPPGDDWPRERVESYLREDNDRMLRLLCIHEGIPGHYLQLAWSNRSPSLTRGIFSSGMFAEGWAVYVTQVMMDMGYGRDDPALLLVHWKFYLRAVTNAIIDVLIHTAEMSEEEALELMIGGSFQEEQEARAKWLRARLTSTQLSTYYLGSLEMWELEEAARRRAAEAAGAGADAVPVQRIVGGLGETPGFGYRAHLESVISHGTPPIKWVKRILSEAG